MAAVIRNILKILAIGGVAAAIAGCPADLPLKGTIKGLASPNNPQTLHVSQAGSKQFKVTWKDPNDSDVDHIEISLRAPLTADAPPAPVNVPLGVQTAIVTVPFNNVQYIVVAKSVDKAGNKSSGVIYSPITLFGVINSALSLNGGNILPVTQAPPKVMYGYSSTLPVLGVLNAETDYTYANGYVTQQSNYTWSGAVKTNNGYTTYQYDYKNNLVKQTDYDTTDTYVIDYYANQYDNNGRMTSQAYYNGGTSTTAPALSYTDSFQYDAYGNQVQENQYDSGGNLSETITYGYDSNGRLLNGTDYNSSGAPQYYINVQWDPTSGFPSSLTITVPGGGTFISMMWTVSPGVLITNVTITLFGTSSATITSNFDSHGLLRSITETGSSPESATFNPDADGNTLQETLYSGSPSTYSGGYSWTY